MRYLLATLLFSVLLPALHAQQRSRTRLELLHANGAETTLRLSLSGVDLHPVLTPQGKANIVTMESGTPLLQKGMPDVPKYATALMIPDQGKMAVEVLASEVEEIAGVEIAPSKGNLKRTVHPDEVPFEYGAAYSTDAFFPEAPAALRQPFVLRDARGQALWIYPVQYNPVRKVLRLYRSITLRVYQTGEPGENERVGSIGPESRAFASIGAKLFLNYQQRVKPRGGASEPEKMLVIVRDNLVDALEPLVTWKRQMGIHTTVVTVSEAGGPEPAAIYDFVKKYYAEQGITYLLLVGDEASIKPEMRQDGEFYSCDNCFGYLQGDDHFPEVLVGRLHAATPEQLRIMVNRNLEYEKNPPADSTQSWYSTGMASASNEGAGIGDDGQADWQQSNEWKTAHLASGYTGYWEFYDGNHGADSPTPGHPSADQDGNPTNTPLVDLINGQGVSLYNYTGHGWEQGLVSGNFNTSAVGNLRNQHRYPILIAVACCAGNFTNGECLGEAWQRAGDAATGAPWGGIAGFFSSDYQSWSPPMEGQDGMNQYLKDADGILLSPTFSSMLAYGNAKMIAAYAADGEIMADFWNPFAEPSAQPRTRLPQALTATHPASIPFETTSLTVNCPVEGALVSLFWENQTWAVGRVVNGSATLEFPFLKNVGELVVTVTQFNYIPYQGTITIEPATHPFVVAQNVVLDDAAGNGNQRADFGEQVQLLVSLKNVGLGLASAVKATLHTDDPAVALANTDVLLGAIAGADTVTASFPFLVANDVENGHPVTFTLAVTYSDSLSISQPVSIVLQAPVLEAGSWTLDDTQFGNGNGYLESGEKAWLRLTNRNTGGSDSPEAVGQLVSLSPFLEIGGPDTLGTLAAQSGEKTAGFLLTATPDAPASAFITLQYKVEAGAYQATREITPLIVNPILETFETNNFSAFNWVLSGNKPWVMSSTLPYAGEHCARSGSISHNQKSVMRLTVLVQSDGYIGFARRVSCEADFDFLRFFIDSTEAGAWSGILPWAEVLFPVTPGLHTFTWSYEKDNVSSAGSDRVWVDEIILPPHQAVVATETPDAPPLEFTASPNPTDGILNLQLDLPEPQQVRVQIANPLGRILKADAAPQSVPAGTWSSSIDLSAFAPGVYVVRLETEKRVGTVKVVKQ